MLAIVQTMLDFHLIFSKNNWFSNETLVIASPGRINIIGEHTDYNDGFVLPAAVDKAVYLAIAPRNDDEIHLYAHDFEGSYQTSLDAIAPLPDSHWANYILGVVAQLQKADYPLKGFNAAMVSDVPIGAGLSSSAAVECATVFALNHLYQLGIDKITMVQMAQKAEHEFVGVMCGIMDMFASMMGKKDHVIKLDCRSLAYEYVPLNLGNYKLVLLNTNVKHSLASSAYNTRRQECEKAVQLVAEEEPGITALRDVNTAMLDAYVKPAHPLIDKRARFVVEEIARLQTACEKLQQGDLHSLGQLMTATHNGLSRDYEVSCRELDWLADFVKENPAVLGSRMMGGGFGGCTINIVAQNAIDDLVASITPAYEAANGLPLSHYVVTTGDGTNIVQG